MASATERDSDRIRPEARRLRRDTGLPIPAWFSRSRARARVRPVDLRDSRRYGSILGAERLADSASLCAVDSSANFSPDSNAGAGFHAYALLAARTGFPILARLRCASCDPALAGADRGGGAHRATAHAKSP